MKFFLINAILILLCFTCDARKQSHVILITQVANGGDWTANTIIGTQKLEVDQVQRDFKIGIPHSYIIKMGPFNCIENFIGKNCDKINSIAPKSADFFIIRLIAQKDTMTCYLNDKQAASAYFNKMIKYIKSSSQNNDFKTLLVELENTLIYLNK